MMSREQAMIGIAFFVFLVILVQPNLFVTLSIPEGHQACTGYQYMEPKIIPVNETCPTEYICQEAGKGFTSKEEAEEYCPNEWKEDTIDPQEYQAQTEENVNEPTEETPDQSTWLIIIGLAIASGGIAYVLGGDN